MLDTIETLYLPKTMNYTLYQPDNHLIIYTDGSCTKNPGGSGGYAAVLLTGLLDTKKDADKSKIIKLSGHIPAPTTNNRAELMAVIVAVFHAQNLGYKLLHINSDSKYVVNTINGQFKTNKNKDLWDLLAIASSTTSSFRAHWVKGHNGNIYNDMADKLASEASKLYT